MDTHVKVIHIFVEIDKSKTVKAEFTSDLVTGMEIKQAAGVPADCDLGRRNGQKREHIPDDQQVTIKNGEHFVALPPGTIS
jgi:hypothetical protein